VLQTIQSIQFSRYFDQTLCKIVNVSNWQT
jgi:hypothetical protein